jgi:hypothetical protein
MTLLSMTRGDTTEFDVTLTDSDGDALNLAGLTLTFTAKRRPTDTDADAVFQKTNGAGIAVTSESGGLATVTVDAADTEGLTFTRSLHWDLQVEAAGEVQTPLSGLLAIADDITSEPAGS